MVIITFLSLLLIPIIFFTLLYWCIYRDTYPSKALKLLQKEYFDRCERLKLQPHLSGLVILTTTPDFYKEMNDEKFVKLHDFKEYKKYNKEL